MNIHYLDYEKEGVAVTEKLQTPCWQLRGVLYRFKTKELAELFYSKIKMLGIDPDDEGFYSNCDWQEMHTGYKAPIGLETYPTIYTIVRGKEIETNGQAIKAARKTAKDVKEWNNKKIEEES